MTPCGDAEALGAIRGGGEGGDAVAAAVAAGGRYTTRGYTMPKQAGVAMTAAAARGVYARGYTAGDQPTPALPLLLRSLTVTPVPQP